MRQMRSVVDTLVEKCQERNFCSCNYLQHPENAMVKVDDT